VRLLEPVSIFSQKFNDYVDSLSTPEARASEIEHAIRHEIHCRLSENPVFYQSLRQRLEELIAAKRQARIDAAEALRHLQQMVNELRGLGQAAQQLGLSETEYALHQLLQGGSSNEVRERPEPYGAAGGDPHQLTREIFSVLEKLAVIDWVHKDDVQREMRRQVKGLLRSSGMSFEEIEAMTAKIIDLARVRLRHGSPGDDNA
jgi:type I restriction enzyme, R subunit